MKISGVFAIPFCIFIGEATLSENIAINSAKPLEVKAGRVVTLKETMRIQDTGEGFYFKEVWDIKAAPDGTLFIKDIDHQVFQFDSRGTFVRSLFKKGSGPGELNEVSTIVLTKDRVFLQGRPPKILAFSFEGTLKGETSLQRIETGRSRLVWAGDEGFFLLKIGRPDLTKGNGWKEGPREIVWISPDGQKTKTVGNFPIDVFVRKGSEGISWATLRDLLVVPLDGNTLIVGQKFEYEMKTIDLRTGAILRRFERSYPRRPLKNTDGTAEIDWPKYLPDIFALHVVEGRIWVQTSTIDAKKGILFDIFEPDGRYVDHFYLKLFDQDMDPDTINWTFSFSGGFVYFSEMTDDDLVVVKKCALVGL